MKQFKLTLVLTILMSMAGLQAFAAWNTSTKVQVDGLYYYLDNDNLQAQVTSKPSGKYTGKIEIPFDFIYKGEAYTVTSIGQSAFSECLYLTSITIPESVTSIGRSAFWACDGLTSIIIPNSVTSIGEEAFYGSGLTSVTIGNSVTSIGYEAFSACYGLTSVTIPNSVTSIGGRAFYRCTGLTSVTIGNSVTSIDRSAFEDCRGLTSITIPNSVTSIGESAFSACYGLTSVTIPNSVTSIGWGAFYRCTGLTSVTIGNSVTSIGGRAFEYCSGLTSVTIPNSVTSIGAGAFSYCSDLTSVTIPNSVTSIGAGAFSYCSDLTSLIVESGNTKYDSRNNCNAIIETASNTLIAGCNATIIPNSVMSIGNSAFSGCSGLTSVTIPSSVTSIGNEAFSGCSGLTSVTIPNGVTSIGYSAFSGCSGLTSVTIPNRVTSIGWGAFSWCSGLTSVTIGNSVTSIGDLAFWDCSALTSVTIPNSVTSIGDEAFYECSSLTSVTLNSDAVVSKVYTADNNIKNIFGEQVTEYIIGDNVKSIGNYAFYGCSNLTSVTIGNNVTSIYYYTFQNCSGLTSVTLNSNDIVSKAYTNYDNMKIIFGNQVTEYIIGDDVTAIGDNAFYGCTDLTSVTIGSGMTSIGKKAFQNCSGLTSVTLNSNDIVSKAYTNYDNMKIIFGNQVTEYIIGDDVTAIGDNAFYGCTDLTSITIPEKVTSIGDNAFYGCTGITSFTIGNNVTSIGQLAFYGCTGLTFITIPDKVTSIGAHAFRDCSGLKSLTIGSGVTSYGNSAFQCSNLTSVAVLNPTPVAITQNVFTNRTNATLYVPKGSKDAYKAADYWKEFKEIIEIDENTQFNLTYIVDGEEYKTYKLKGNEVITPEPDPIKEGYTFSGWSEIPSTMPYHDVTINGYFKKEGTTLDEYIENSVTSLSNNYYNISPTINNVERVYVDLTKSTSNESYCYLEIKNKVNSKKIELSSKYLQSTSSDNLVVYEGSNSIRRSIKDLANNNTYPWLYYNPENTNEVIIDVKAYFGCTGYIERWQKNFGTSCVVKIETEKAETSVRDIRDSSIKDDRYYNLQGQRVLSPKKGIYIINGKKVVVK